MSIEKDYKEYFIVCDDCGATEGAFETFEDAVNAKKELGWKAKKTINGWEDFCTKCQK